MDTIIIAKIILVQTRHFHIIIIVALELVIVKLVSSLATIDNASLV